MRLINRRPGRALALFLALLPFAAALVAYMIASEARLAANPADRLLPAPATIAVSNLPSSCAKYAIRMKRRRRGMPEGLRRRRATGSRIYLP
jgi:hypothetical protein